MVNVGLCSVETVSGKFANAGFVKAGAVVIDAGINRGPAPNRPKGSKLVGDVAFDSAAPKCRASIPVPGGVSSVKIIETEARKKYLKNFLACTVESNILNF